MGAVARREERDGVEVHVSTGKLFPEGMAHSPVWSEWRPEHFNIEMRFCTHPNCDLDDYRKTKEEDESVT